jgi:hypothetical protein
VLPLWPWFWRFVALAGGSVLLGRVLHPQSLPSVVVTAAVVGVLYLAFMIPAMMKTPLRAYLIPRIAWAKDLALQAMSSCTPWRREVLPGD